VPSGVLGSTTPNDPALAKYRAEEQLSIDELPLCRDIMVEQWHRAKAASKEAFR